MKLKILNIEDNLNDQIILKRILETKLRVEFKITYSLTGKDGLDKATEETFDLILLDYKLPDLSGLEFLEELRKKRVNTPVIFLTGMGNEKVAVEAMKRGVKDYIVKDDLQSSKFIESIRDILTEKFEKEKNDNKKEEKVLLSGIEEEILNKLKEQEIDTIKFEYKNNEYDYHGLNSLKKKYGLLQIEKNLYSLYNKDYLDIIDEKRIVLCPKCSDSDYSIVNINYICPKCQSDRIDKVELIEHQFCGYIGERHKYISDSFLKCPNCNIILQEKNKDSKDIKTDYNVLGTSFECQNCKILFSKPEMIHICEKCNLKFDYKTMIYRKIYEYKMNDKTPV